MVKVKNPKPKNILLMGRQAWVLALAFFFFFWRDIGVGVGGGVVSLDRVDYSQNVL